MKEEARKIAEEVLDILERRFNNSNYYELMASSPADGNGYTGVNLIVAERKTSNNIHISATLEENDIYEMPRYEESNTISVDKENLYINIGTVSMGLDKLRQIAENYHSLCAYEYLKENFKNEDEVLWDIALQVYDEQREAEANGYPITEGEAIEHICSNMGVILIEG